MNDNEKRIMDFLERHLVLLERLSCQIVSIAPQPDSRFGWLPLVPGDVLNLLRYATYGATEPDAITKGRKPILKMLHEADYKKICEISDEILEEVHRREALNKERPQCPVCKGYLRSMDSEGREPHEMDGGIAQCCDCSIYNDMKTALRAFEQDPPHS